MHGNMKKYDAMAAMKASKRGGSVGMSRSDGSFLTVSKMTVRSNRVLITDRRDVPTVKAVVKKSK